MSIRFQNFFLAILIFILSTFCAVPFAHAQTDDERIQELHRQIQILEDQAAQYRDSIANERTKGQTLKQEITVLKNQALQLQTQIMLTGKKIDTTKIEISRLQDLIFDTQQRIEQQKGAVGRLIVFLDRTDQESLFATLLKNHTLSDFFRQTQYAATLNAQLLNFIAGLQTTQQDLDREKLDMEGKQTELERLNNEQAAKKNALNSTTTQKNQLLVTTKSQEAQYQKLLSDTERKHAEFFTELQILEKNIVVGGLYILHITATNIPPKKTKILQWPEEGYRVTQGYGMTTYARRGAYGGAPHNGVDISGGYGSNVMAAADGVVVANGKNSGWGNWLAIKHADNLVTLYAHMSGFAMPVGATVKAGDTIGYEGNTGNATGSHLHLSLYRDFFTYEKNGELYFNYFDGSLNPLDYL